MAKIRIFFFTPFFLLWLNASPLLMVYIPEKLEFSHEVLKGLEEEWKGEIRILEEWANPSENDVIWIGLGKQATETLLRYVMGKPIVAAMVTEKEKQWENRVSVLSLRILNEQYWEYAKAMIPGVRTVGIPEFPNTSREFLQRVEAQIKAKGMKVVHFPCRVEKELFQGIRSIAFDILWLHPDPMLDREETLEWVMRTSIEWGKVPIGYLPVHTKKGALFSLSVDFFQFGKQMADLAYQTYSQQKVFEEYPKHLEFTVNSKTAALFHFRIPQMLIKRAHTVY